MSLPVFREVPMFTPSVSRAMSRLPRSHRVSAALNPAQPEPITRVSSEYRSTLFPESSTVLMALSFTAAAGGIRRRR